MVTKRILTVGLIGTALSGCGSQYMHYGYDEIISLGDFRATVEHLRAYAPCKWESRGQVGSRVQYDYGCHGGAWNTSTLLVNQTQKEVDQIRVLWRERPESLTFKEDRRIADEFLLAALRYATPEAAGHIRGEFFKHTNKQIMYGPLNLVLTSEKQDRGEWLNRLVITDTREIHARPQYQRRGAVIPSKKPLGVYERPSQKIHDPYGEVKVPETQPTTAKAAPETANAINKIRRPIQAHEIMESRDMARGVEPRTQELAEQILESRKPMHDIVQPRIEPPVPVHDIVQPRIESRAPMHDIIQPEMPVMETAIRSEAIRIEPQAQRPVLEVTQPQNREERLRNILMHAAEINEDSAKAETSKVPENYISHEETYLKDVEDEVYRQMKSQYDSSGSSSSWEGLKELRDGLEIMEFNLPDEGGL